MPSSSARATALGDPVSTYLHAHRVEDMLDGVRLGADRLVHTIEMKGEFGGW